jgi:hypothetical protein
MAKIKNALYQHSSAVWQLHQQKDENAIIL